MLQPRTTFSYKRSIGSENIAWTKFGQRDKGTETHTQTHGHTDTVIPVHYHKRRFGVPVNTHEAQLRLN